MIIITLCFAFRCLHFFPEMTATTLFAIECIHANQFTQLNKIGNPSCLIQFRIQFIYFSRDFTYSIQNSFSEILLFHQLRCYQSLFIPVPCRISPT